MIDRLECPVLNRRVRRETRSLVSIPSSFNVKTLDWSKSLVGCFSEIRLHRLLWQSIIRRIKWSPSTFAHFCSRKQPVAQEAGNRTENVWLSRYRRDVCSRGSSTAKTFSTPTPDGNAISSRARASFSLARTRNRRVACHGGWPSLGRRSSVRAWERVSPRWHAFSAEGAYYWFFEGHRRHRGLISIKLIGRLVMIARRRCLHGNIAAAVYTAISIRELRLTRLARAWFEWDILLARWPLKIAAKRREASLPSSILYSALLFTSDRRSRSSHLHPNDLYICFSAIVLFECVRYLARPAGSIVITY